jgi:hypothetical protein
MNEHYSVILAHNIHVQGGEDGVQIESTFHKVQKSYIVSHWHANFPVFENHKNTQFGFLKMPLKNAI